MTTSALINELKSKYNTFAISHNTYSKSTFDFDDNEYTVFGIERSHMKEYAIAISNDIKSHFGNSQYQITQIVGNSALYDYIGMMKGAQSINHLIKKDQIIEFGLTSVKTDPVNPQLRCVNGLVSDFVEQYRLMCVGNIVGQSFEAIDKWGAWISPYVKCFIMVFDRDQTLDKIPQYESIEGKFTGKRLSGYTVFGDDQIADMICDSIISLDGGMQSFDQTNFVLQSGKEVILVTGMKARTNWLFSTAKMFKIIEKLRSESQNTIKKKINEYISSFGMISNTEIGYEIPKLFNIQKPDWRSKKALFERAMTRFTGEEYVDFKFTDTMIDKPNYLLTNYVVL